VLRSGRPIKQDKKHRQRDETGGARDRKEYVPHGRQRRAAAQPQTGDSAEHNASDLRDRGGVEQNDQSARQGDRGPLPVGAERQGHAPNRLRHDGDGDEL
jgi:hypothetical protein